MNKTSFSATTPAVPGRNRAQLWALFALIVYTPLPLASDRPWAMALLGLLTGCLFLWNLWRPGRRPPGLAWQGARIPLILLGLWMVILVFQLFALPETWINVLGLRTLNGFVGRTISIDAYSTLMHLAKACILMLVFWLVVTLVDSRRRLELLAMVIVFSGLFQAMLGVILMATGTTFELFFVPLVDVYAHGTFVYHNHLAGYLELTLATGIGLMIAKLDGRSSASWRQRMHGWLALLFSEKVMLRVCLIIMVVGLVATRSRMGNMAFFASLLITGVFTVIITKYMTRNVREKRTTEITRSMIVFIISLIVLDVVIIGGVVGIEKVVQRIENTNLETQSRNAPEMVQEGSGGQVSQVHRQEESVEQRSKAARSAMQIVRDFPWAGTGGGTFHLSFLHYQPEDVQGFVDHAHNDFVEFASEVGLPGLLLLAVLVLHSVVRAAMLLARSNDQLARGMAFASLMGIVSLLIHGAVDFNFQNPANAMLFLIVLSLPYLQAGLSRR